MGKKLHAFLPQNISSSAHFAITANICTSSLTLTAWESIQAAIVSILSPSHPYSLQIADIKEIDPDLIEVNSSLHKLGFLS